MPVRDAEDWSRTLWVEKQGKSGQAYILQHPPPKPRLPTPNELRLGKLAICKYEMLKREFGNPPLAEVFHGSENAERRERKAGELAEMMAPAGGFGLRGKGDKQAGRGEEGGRGGELEDGADLYRRGRV